MMEHSTSRAVGREAIAWDDSPLDPADPFDTADPDRYVEDESGRGVRSLGAADSKQMVRLYRTDDTYAVQEVPVAAAYRWLSFRDKTGKRRLWIDEAELLGRPSPDFLAAMTDLETEMESGISANRRDPHAGMRREPLSPSQLATQLRTLHRTRQMKNYRWLKFQDHLPGGGISDEAGTSYPELFDTELTGSDESQSAAATNAGESSDAAPVSRVTNDVLLGLLDQMKSLTESVGLIADRQTSLEARLNIDN